MADARVTQIARYVLTLEDTSIVRVTQIARRVLYEFTCETVTPPIFTPTPPPPDCPEALLVDPPTKALPHFLRTHGYLKQGPAASGTMITTPAPGKGFKRRF